MRVSLVIITSLFVAMLLSIIEMPHWSLWARPEWTLLVVLYWVLAIPERCGVLFAAAIGLLQDSLTGSIMGAHMLSYSLVVTVALMAYKQLRMFDAWQQAGFIFFLVGLEQLIEYWIGLVTGQIETGLWFLFPAIISALIWPWLMVVLRSLRRKTGLVNRIA